MSVWHTPHARRRTSASPGPGSARSTSVTLSGRPNSSSTAARIFTLELLSRRGPTATLLGRRRAVAFHRPLTLDGMVDDRSRIVRSDHAARLALLRLAHPPRLGEVLVGHVAQLRPPAAHVLAAGAVAALPGERVE